MNKFACAILAAVAVGVEGKITPIADVVKVYKQRKAEQQGDHKL